ncbi:MAG: nitroreductase family protein [Actinomycetota bacterium]
MNIEEIDVASIDHVLTTTRAVRKRLDLERPVDQQIIYDCIDIAEQAPSGGNQGSRRWVVVRDPRVKQQIADLYMETGGHFMIGARDKIAGTGHPQERVMESAAYLAEHLAEVPAIVIPTIMGRHDGSGRPGLFDSVIQSVWSFCVALRARGLGTAYTTAILGKRDELREVLGVPEDNTQIAMIPVAWFTGEDFRQAPRYAARDITGIDRYAHQWESGPSDPPCLADGPMTTVEVDIKATTDAVWQRVSDINFPVEYSEEVVGVRWADGVDGPSLGAEFIGSNQHEAIGEWDVPCFVNRYVEGKEFGWASASAENPGARWWFDLASIAGATRVRFSVALGPGPSGISAAIDAMPDKEPRILFRRIQEHRANMQRMIDGLAAELTRPPEDRANPIFGD